MRAAISPPASSVIRKPTLLACGACAVALALAASAGGGPAETPSGPLELRLELRDAAGQDAQRFAAGETVDLVLEVHNAGDAPLALEFATARTHDFAVLDSEGLEVWRWSHGRLFAQALAEIELAPGETRRFAASWDKRDASGALARPGRYQVLGTLACSPSPPPAGPLDLQIE
jgi:hypothetical protein